jgi:hypothetical protein
METISFLSFGLIDLPSVYRIWKQVKTSSWNMRFVFKKSRRKNLRLQDGKVKGVGSGIELFIWDLVIL